jgi:hypothetical protein
MLLHLFFPSNYGPLHSPDGTEILGDQSTYLEETKRKIPNQLYLTEPTAFFSSQRKALNHSVAYSLTM